MTSKVLTIWDSDENPPDSEQLVYLWNGHSQTSTVRALLRYLEENAERFRSIYLTWIYDLGERRIKGKRLIDHLALADGLSYWWFISLGLKDIYEARDSPVTDILRLLALEEIVAQQKPDRLRLVSPRRELHQVVHALCRDLGIHYEWVREAGASRRLTRSLVCRSLPHPLQAILGLARYVRRSVPFRRMPRPVWFEGREARFFCGYFANVVSEEAAKGRFYSRYWEGLHGLMQKMGFLGNWLHHNILPSPEVAMNWVRSFNCAPREQGEHGFLDAYWSWRAAFRVIGKWLRLNGISFRLGRSKSLFKLKGSSLSLWPLIQEKWHSFLVGERAMVNLISLELFDLAVRDLPHQKIGFYLCENCEWELALIHAWRKQGHSRLIAVPHATMNFWDLRMFSDSRVFDSSDPCSMPMQDITVVNGKAARDIFLKAGYPDGFLMEGEALRYGYLKESSLERVVSNMEDRVVRVLILGDILHSSTMQLLRLVEKVAPKLGDRFVYTLKSHPLCPIAADVVPHLKLTISTEPLSNILSEYDIVCASNGTSASVDAYFFGLPVVVMLEHATLNLSPLRHHEGVRFVSTAEELAKALQAPAGWAKASASSDSFFFLDQEMPRWKKLLESSNDESGLRKKGE